MGLKVVCILQVIEKFFMEDGFFEIGDMVIKEGGYYKIFGCM